MGIEIARWLVALGSVAAAVGLTLAGMGSSTLLPMEDLIRFGVILMVGGLIVFVIGILAHHRLDDSDTTIEF